MNILDNPGYEVAKGALDKFHESQKEIAMNCIEKFDLQLHIQNPSYNVVGALAT